MKGLTAENENRFTPENTYQDQPIFGNIDKVHRPIQNEIKEMKLGLEQVLSLIHI